MEEDKAVRILLLGKYGAGVSSLANTVLGEDVFSISSCSDSKTGFSQSTTRSVHGRTLTLIDSSGLVFPGRSKEDGSVSKLRCRLECAPGPHVFLIVLKVEKFTEHEEDIIAQICKIFPEGALKHAAIVFTKGDQLSEGKTIRQFVQESKELSAVAAECGGRVHVFDNKYWKQSQQGEYRSNQFQLAELLKTIEEIVSMHNKRHYTDKMLQGVESQIKEEEMHVRESSGNMRNGEIREQAKRNVLNKQLKRFQWWGWALRLVVPGCLVIVAAVIVSKYSSTLMKYLNL
ncbi:unnamed protein product [Ophioblennius macclurei]